ncbi:MAG: type II toxin-antitoxin system RelE/ParE family toxin [Deferribacteraceae bacterium]|jgi:toxin ParE1/3/4|nr:type II toxin-antitoxin system RelE/ParE family toxin [Deferribacteraceae bacterium]
MPHIIKWTRNALNGLERIYAFLAEIDKDVAIAAIKAIREKTLLLEQFPNAGRPADDLEPEHRELVIPFGASGYILVYEVYDDYLVVLAIKHQKEAGYLGLTL